MCNQEARFYTIVDENCIPFEISSYGPPFAYAKCWGNDEGYSRGNRYFCKQCLLKFFRLGEGKLHKATHYVRLDNGKVLFKTVDECMAGRVGEPYCVMPVLKAIPWEKLRGLMEYPGVYVCQKCMLEEGVLW